MFLHLSLVLALVVLACGIYLIASVFMKRRPQE